MFRILLAAAVAISQPAAQQQQVERLAASFISNYPSYVTWPKQDGSPIRVGIAGENFVGEAGVTYLQQRPFDVQMGDEDLERLQILLVGELPPDELEKLLKKAEKLPILTVGTASNFIEKGGIIQMKIDGTAVTWKVSLPNGKKAGLKIDPRLISYGQTM